jgi:cytochrome c biogenesis protein CcmG, thiol:disulfide interchange protein DsbE
MGKLAVAISLLALAACDSGGEPVVANHVERPAKASTIEIVGLEGLEAAIAARRGHGFLLNFWAIWCPPCVAEMPELVEVARAYRERGGAVIGVSYDLMIAGAERATIERTVRDFLAGRELDLPVLIYDAPDHESINQRFGLPGEIPVTLAIDKTGQIVDRQHGQAGRERFDEMMRKALGL